MILLLIIILIIFCCCCYYCFCFIVLPKKKNSIIVIKWKFIAPQQQTTLLLNTLLQPWCQPKKNRRDQGANKQWLWLFSNFGSQVFFFQTKRSSLLAKTAATLFNWGVTGKFRPPRFPHQRQRVMKYWWWMVNFGHPDYA